MRLTLHTFVTLDGVMQAPGGPTEDPSDGFDHGGWFVSYAAQDPQFGEAISRWFEQADAFLLGRRTYEIFAAHWPRVDATGDPVATGLNTLPKHVASTTLDSVDWQNSTLIKGDVVDAVAELKRADGGELQVHGSQGLAQTLIRAGLIDEYRLITAPIVLGQGRRLFADGAVPMALRRTHSETTGSGLRVDVYEPAGEPELGSFQLED
jgi:dihydrofolate reductase